MSHSLVIISLPPSTHKPQNTSRNIATECVIICQFMDILMQPIIKYKWFIFKCSQVEYLIIA